MIFVRRDISVIPEGVLRVAERAQNQLEALPPGERAAFIKKKSHIWRKFARYLRKMSYGKCWYSESDDPQSFFDVDHFRPKLEAQRSKDETDGGYEWLAFSWDNFRLSAQRSNRLSRNEETDVTEGKGSWFPLLEGSPRACWDDRCEDDELPLLLDPVVQSDVRLIDVLDDGRVGPSTLCIGSGIERVTESAKLYGLNLPNLTSARRRVIREINNLHEVLARTLEAGREGGAVADMLPIDEQIEILKDKTLPSSPYARTARAQLRRLGMSELIASPEEEGAEVPA